LRLLNEVTIFSFISLDTSLLFHVPLQCPGLRSDGLLRPCRVNRQRYRSNATPPRRCPFSLATFEISPSYLTSRSTQHHHTNSPPFRCHPTCLNCSKPRSNQVHCLANIVDTVLSGDTLVLLGKPRADGKPPNERILSLAYVSAPRLKREGDEVSPIVYVMSAGIDDRPSHLRQESI
jgi:hypothetical protein